MASVNISTALFDFVERGEVCENPEVTWQRRKKEKNRMKVVRFMIEGLGSRISGNPHVLVCLQRYLPFRMFLNVIHDYRDDEITFAPFGL
jgi:hypothetical protein